jgi:P27 family predicted phage terminase small subunit
LRGEKPSPMSSKVATLSTKTKPNNVVKVPKHLTAASKRFYEQVCNDYVLESHHERLLQLLCEAFDRGQEARKVLEEEGLTVVDSKLGIKRPHPCISIERDSRTAVARLTRELNLSEEPNDSRPPKLKYGGKR